MTQENLSELAVDSYVEPRHRRAVEEYISEESARFETQTRNKVFLDKIRALMGELEGCLLSADLYLDGINMLDLKGPYILDTENFYQALVDAEKENEALI